MYIQIGKIAEPPVHVIVHLVLQIVHLDRNLVKWQYYACIMKLAEKLYAHPFITISHSVKFLTYLYYEGENILRNVQFVYQQRQGR